MCVDAQTGVNWWNMLKRSCWRSQNETRVWVPRSETRGRPWPAASRWFQEAESTNCCSSPSFPPPCTCSEEQGRFHWDFRGNSILNKVWTFYLSIHPPASHLSSMHLSIIYSDSFIYPSSHLSINLSICLSICPSIRQFHHPSIIYPSNHQFLHPYIHESICPFVHHHHNQFIQASLHPSCLWPRSGSQSALWQTGSLWFLAAENKARRRSLSSHFLCI